ncbi:DUF6913 domain-containing protein [Flavobacterium orientale]|uniref:Uncharacterized protein n=1 Tax=Flavobacterium orientale TaxID=1756020 RepID=A0A916XW54_9FLAO|nr:hypothetical protein [Flavobacterium orientale]GGD16610.1 hypothetical protein GCM10011343_04370 [Flavobacterium orientale]
MFLKDFKNFYAKRIIKKRLDNCDSEVPNTKITTIGLLVDETDFAFKDNLIKALLSKGFESQNIKVLSFKNSYKKKEEIQYPHFSKKDISWIGSVENKIVKEFKQEPFDLLISYYDQKKAPLVVVSNNSKAKFKVGFSNIDKRLFHLMIDTPMENYVVFIDELEKYLKILNKI